MQPTLSLNYSVYAKDGEIASYGSTPEARLEVSPKTVDANGAQTGPPVLRRFGWLRSRVADRLGNYMTYTYARDGLNSPERIETWLTRIDYGGFGTYCSTPVTST